MNNQLIQQELSQIAESNNGLLRPVDVVEFAKDPATALHYRFEWDDTLAGHQHRLKQARETIVNVKTWTNPKAKAPMQVYVSMSDDRTVPNGGYRLTVDVMSDEQQREQLLAQLKKEIQTLQKKYKLFQELAKAFENMAEAVEVVS